MKSMTSRMAVASALATLSLSAVADEGRHGKQVVERHDGAAAQARGVGEVLASWTGCIPVGTPGRTVAFAESDGEGLRVDRTRTAARVLSSWSGSVPVEAGDRVNAHRGGEDASGMHVSGATDVLASWNGWSSSRAHRAAP